MGDGGCDVRTPTRRGEEAMLTPTAGGPRGVTEPACGDPARAWEGCPACT